MPGHKIWMDRQTDGRDSFIPPVFVCGRIITGEHLQYLHSVFRHTEDMHLLLWTVLTNVFLDFLHVELVFFNHSITWAVPSMCNLKLKKCSINFIQTFTCFKCLDMLRSSVERIK
jgi:hypothetical protein